MEVATAVGAAGGVAVGDPWTGVGSTAGGGGGGAGCASASLDAPSQIVAATIVAVATTRSARRRATTMPIAIAASTNSEKIWPLDSPA